MWRYHNGCWECGGGGQGHGQGEWGQTEKSGRRGTQNWRGARLKTRGKGGAAGAGSSQHQLAAAGAGAPLPLDRLAVPLVACRLIQSRNAEVNVPFALAGRALVDNFDDHPAVGGVLLRAADAHALAAVLHVGRVGRAWRQQRGKQIDRQRDTQAGKQNAERALASPARQRLPSLLAAPRRRDPGCCPALLAHLLPVEDMAGQCAIVPAKSARQWASKWRG